MRQSAPSPWFRCQAGRPRGHSLVPVGCTLGAGGTGVQGGMQSRGPTMPAFATEAQCKAWGHFALSCFPRTEPAWGLQPASPKPPPHNSHLQITSAGRRPWKPCFLLGHVIHPTGQKKGPLSRTWLSPHSPCPGPVAWTPITALLVSGHSAAYSAAPRPGPQPMHVSFPTCRLLPGREWTHPSSPSTPATRALLPRGPCECSPQKG